MAVVILSSRRKTTRKIDYTACIGSDDTFGMVYYSMTQSQAYKNLSLAEKHFYTICRIQSRTKQAHACLSAHGQEYGIEYDFEKDFVFPSSHLERFGYNRSNGYRLLKSLSEKGFIKVKENNRALKHVNVYSFIGEWKNERKGK